MFLALDGKLLSQLFLFRFFFSIHLFPLCDLSILLFTFHYTRRKSHLHKLTIATNLKNMFPLHCLRQLVIFKTKVSLIQLRKLMLGLKEKKSSAEHSLKLKRSAFCFASLFLLFFSRLALS